MPEKQAAEWAAIRYASNHILDYIRLDDDHAIYEVTVPSEWIGKTIGQIDIRKRFGITIMAVKKNGRMILSVTPETMLKTGITMLVLGEYKAMQRCFHI
jgi:trk system potassium uptake protein TrkA